MTALQVETQLRKATLPALVAMLREQNDVKFDAVVPASALSYVGGVLHVADAAMRIVETPDGISSATAPAMLMPTQTFEAGVSQRLGIPGPYLRTLRETPVAVSIDLDDDHDGPTGLAIERSLLDLNVNGWLQKAAREGKRFLVRAFRTDDPDQVGIARALLSNGYGITDNYDVILAVLAAIRDAGIDTHSLDVVCDLSERGMSVRVNAPHIGVDATEMLRNYRDPRTGRKGVDYPIVNAGLYIGNGETGGAAFVVAPRIEYQVCTNGQTRTVDGYRAVHVGGRMDETVIRWSQDTHEKNLALISAKTRDAVQTFMSTGYVEQVLDGMREQYGTPITDAKATIERVAKKHRFTEAETADILDAFIKGGDLTAGGVMQAVTYAAQDLADPDRAAEFEDVAFDVLATAASR